MKKTAHADVPADSADRPSTLGGWLAHAERLYAQHQVAVGQIATSAHDEALYLLLRALHLPLDSGPAVLARRVSGAEGAALEKVLRRRVVDRVPAAYLTHEAFLGGHRFYIDERAIIPRSYFLEIIPQLDRWLKKPAAVARVADMCTGSGCLAILLAHQFPKARVDAVDCSADALAVAKINVRQHGLSGRVSLYRSDVFASVPAAHYDVIVCNPPYEPSRLMKTLPPEFRWEPALALDGGKDGLDVIRRLIEQARDRLAPDGLLLIEVGGLRNAMEAAFGGLKPLWLRTRDGSNCVCLARMRHISPGSSATVGSMLTPAKPGVQGIRA
jgi:ribosomal protein L3 glutamine methyltransferase